MRCSMMAGEVITPPTIFVNDYIGNAIGCTLRTAEGATRLHRRCQAARVTCRPWRSRSSTRPSHRQLVRDEHRQAANGMRMAMDLFHLQPWTECHQLHIQREPCSAYVRPDAPWRRVGRHCDCHC